jgi:raffinose/stachyose/melibiose transport system substrate-binding protein
MFNQKKGEKEVKKRSSLMMLAFVLVLSLFLTACGDKETGTKGNGEKEPVVTDEKVQLRIVTMFGGTDPSTEVLKSSLEQFKKDNPNVEIIEESMTAGDEFRTKVFADFSSGNEPDVTFFFTGKDAKDIIEAGKVVALDDLLKEDAAWADGFSDAALEQVRAEDGNLYAIPLTGYYEGLIVNKKLFEDNGLELPTDWAKFETAIKTFSEKGIVPLGASLVDSYYLIEHYILAAGGTEGNTAGLANGIHDSWKTGLDQIKAHAEMGAFPKDTNTIDDTLAQQLYQQGQAAMMINGSWALGGIPDDVKANTTVLPMPVMPGGKATYGDVVSGFGSGYYLSKKAYEDASKKDAAVALIKFLTSKETVAAFAKANGGVPAAKVTVEGLPQAAVDGHKMIADATSLSYPIDSQIKPEAFTHIRTNVPQIAASKKTVEEVLTEAQKIETE